MSLMGTHVLQVDLYARAALELKAKSLSSTSSYTSLELYERWGRHPSCAAAAGVAHRIGRRVWADVTSPAAARTSGVPLEVLMALVRLLKWLLTELLPTGVPPAGPTSVGGDRSATLLAVRRCTNHALVRCNARTAGG